MAKITPLNESILPKVDVEKVVLGTYLAVQILKTDRSYKDVVRLFMEAANAQGLLFYKLQVLDVMVVGTTSIVRMRTDLHNAESVTGALAGRANIVANTGGYVMRHANGKTGKVLSSTMCTPHKPGFGQLFAGTKIARWAHQFQSAGS